MFHVEHITKIILVYLVYYLWESLTVGFGKN